MKEFDDWHAEHFTEWKGFSDISGKGVVKSQQEMLKEAFTAGMLAAADLAEKLCDQWTEADYHKFCEMTPSRSTGAEAIEFVIREAAK